MHKWSSPTHKKTTIIPRTPEFLLHITFKTHMSPPWKMLEPEVGSSRLFPFESCHPDFRGSQDVSPRNCPTFPVLSIREYLVWHNAGGAAGLGSCKNWSDFRCCFWWLTLLVIYKMAKNKYGFPWGSFTPKYVELYISSYLYLVFGPTLLTPLRNPKLETFHQIKFSL